ncbi:FHA domain-containing protein [bacterium]|nr:FHA domain-containing protein [bacterium]
MFFFRRKEQKKIEKPWVLEPKEAPEAVVEPTEPTAEVAEPEAPVIDPARRKRRRNASGNKTRLMGFDTSDGRVVDLFDDDKATAPSTSLQFPVALVMVTKGAGFGECFGIKSGMSQIGRGEDQAIRLDFGDMAISRENHAAIVYDPKKHSFLIGHGGKSNIVRLNGKPVVSTSDLKDGDTIEIGETQMRFIAICSDEFDWKSAETEEGIDDDDVEIA